MKKIIPGKEKSKALFQAPCICFAPFLKVQESLLDCMKIVNEDSKIYSLDPRNYLFNGQDKGDYVFGQGIINEASINDKAYLVLYKSWCLFMYREFYKNLLTILDQVSIQMYGEKQTGTPNTFCKFFDLHDDEKIEAFLMKLSNITHTNLVCHIKQY